MKAFPDPSPATSGIPSRTARRALAAWQRRNGAYREVQRLLREPHNPPAGPDGARIASLVGELAAAIHAGVTVSDMVVFRGVRKVDLALGPALTPGATHNLAGFVATTRDPLVTLEFIPNGGTILKLEVPAGTPAVDVAAFGDPHMARQQELLLPDGLRIEITGQTVGSQVSTDPRLADTMVITARVIHDQPLR